MAATVGSISIDLVTNANSFASGFKSSAQTVEQQSARMAKSVAAVEKGVIGIGTTLKNFGVGVAAGVGLAALGSLSGAFQTLKQTISEYDEIATNAKQTGLKSDTFQALSFAAKQANIEQESFNTSLTIFAKNAGLAEKGTGALYSGLIKLNPQLLQNILNAKDQEERLKLVSDALAQTTDATQKAALAAVVFGKSGVEMARFLDQGRASIEAMKKTAQGLGIIVPDSLLQKAGELDDKLDLLSQVIHVQLGEALINLAPLLVDATAGFADFSKQINTTAASLENFVNNPSWANLENLVVALGGEKFREGSILDRLAKGNLAPGGAEDVAQLTKGIDFLTTKIAELQAQAEQGANVKLEIADATASLNDLESQLHRIQATAEEALNNPAGSFDNLLKSMGGTAPAASPGVLPNVTRYGGDPNKITLPGAGAPVVQNNANGSGVSVTKYNSETADNTGETADNVSTLDKNTKSYLRGLSNDIGGYSSQTNVTISKLSDVVRGNIGGLSSSILSLLTAGGGPGKAGGIGGGAYAFGDSFDPNVGSYISSWGIGSVKRPSVNFPTTSSDGTYNQDVSVAQPGSPITLNYHAAAGESTQTAKQNARAMFDELVRAQASA
ncbi:hypothetical protein LB557_23650 [Mesorhizobium sp. BR115XR7A]|uniref:hypothetical protein n=1 Tax=Mesorhizobium sp. BR115XR7A TaxID=2876645 RepID=UPI001CCF123C|nr:hypothetical protein [Mesorhizobium sp. BR115XR7A]MBZ9909008.1 hypothetical protein [Mesorhizobium sp. BR115XR7A]MBZ9933459.1 hypothetical protein [Mesorhizobium sp. BR1-1-5]